MPERYTDSRDREKTGLKKTRVQEEERAFFAPPKKKMKEIRAKPDFLLKVFRACSLYFIYL